MHVKNGAFQAPYNQPLKQLLKILLSEFSPEKKIKFRYANIWQEMAYVLNTVKLDFKNRQDKNQLGFKNQITNDQFDQISFKDHQDKNNLTLRTKMVVTKNVLKVKFDCILCL